MMQYLSLFSGIGAFEKALENLKVKYDLVGYSEIDKYASKSYSAIHGWGESYNLGDITKIDERSLPKGIDLVTYGFPCQDISLAGKQRGFFHEDGTQTRSGLFFDALRIIKECQPKIAIAENVKNLTGKKFKEQFEIVLSSLEEAGYNNYWQILNAKDYGIPQNRERVFIVSIRKDIDTGIFEFPKGFPLEKRLKDVLEDEVDEKFYLTDYTINKIQNSNFSQEATRIQGDVCQTLLARDYKDPKCVVVREPTDVIRQVANVSSTATRKNPNQGRVYDPDYIAPTLSCMGGGNREPHVIVKEATSKGYAEAYEGDSINLEQPNSKTRRGRVGKQVAQTLTTSPQQAVVEPQIIEDFYKNRDERIYEEYSPSLRSERNGLKVNNGLRIRKLTPKECFRLMGFDDEDFYKAEKVNSNTQLYKQAGNSIVVNVAEELFCMMLDEKGNILI